MQCSAASGRFGCVRLPKELGISPVSMPVEVTVMEPVGLPVIQPVGLPVMQPVGLPVM